MRIMLIRLIVPEPLFLLGIKPRSLFQSLTLTYLAALTPPEFDVEISDGSTSEIPLDKKADIVGISFMSDTYSRAYEIADNYKKMGIPVILGGFHTSLFPDEALEHADTIVVGEAEGVWKNLLSDFQKGNLKRVYKSDTLSDLKNLPIPRYDLYNQVDYSNLIPVFATRGCPYHCYFCCIRSVYGTTFRKRPVEDVVNQIKFIKKEYEGKEPPLTIDFIDDNIWGDVKYAKELFRSLTPLEIRWNSQASMNIDPELLELAAESGCKTIFVGFESLNDRNLNYLNKKHNKPELYGELIARMHQLNIAVGAFFMVGLPYDDRHCFDTLADFLENNFVEAPIPLIFCPIPGTEQFNKEDWKGKTECKDYNSIINAIPIFTPHNTAKKQFKRAYVNFARMIYSDESIERRLRNCDNPGLYFMNKRNQEYYNASKMDDWAEQ